MIEPGMPDVLIEHGNEVYQRADGERTVAPHVIADEETWGQLVSGYRCMRCFQIQSQPFPERCEFTVEFEGSTWRCPMRIRDEQLPALNRSFRSEADFSPPDPYQSLDDERDYWKPHPLGIVVPNHPGFGS